MEKEFKKRLEEAGDAIEELENKVEGFAEDFTGDVVQLWADVKTNFSGVKEKLKTAIKDLDEKGDEAQLQAHLAAMEARERVQVARESLEEFTHKVSLKSQAELDTVRLRAHLAEMEVADFWEENGKKITEDFKQSSEKAKELSYEAASEVKDYFEKLVEKFTKVV
jgi:gas vesicle protein